MDRMDRIVLDSERFSLSPLLRKVGDELSTLFNKGHNRSFTFYDSLQDTTDSCILSIKKAEYGDIDVSKKQPILYIDSSYNECIELLPIIESYIISIRIQKAYFASNENTDLRTIYLNKPLEDIYYTVKGNDFQYDVNELYKVLSYSFSRILEKDSSHE